MSRTQRYTFLAGILIIATFLRFYHLTTIPPGLYPDEAVNGNNAVEVAETGHAQSFYIENNGREGLYINILAAVFKVLPPGHADLAQAPWMVRLPAAVAGVLTVLGLYLLVAELFGNGPGLLAAFLIATSFWHVIFSRIGFRAILTPLLLVWALWLFLKAIRSTVSPSASTSARSVRGWWYAITGGIVYGLGFYTYIPYRITPLLFLLFIPFLARKPGFWKWTAVFLAVTFLVAAPLGWYFVQHPADFFGRTAEISVTSASNPIVAFARNLSKELLMLNWHGDYNWRQNVSGAAELAWPVGIVFLIGFFLGLYSLWKSWRTRHAAAREDLFPPFALTLMYAWFAVGILPAAASNEGIPHALRSILMIPPVLTFAALGAGWLYQLMRRYLHGGDARPRSWMRWIAPTVAAAFIITVGIYGYVDYFVAWAANPNVPGAFAANYVDIGNRINTLPAGTPKYVIVNAGGVLVRGIPMPAETVMFVTHSFTAADAAARNIHYVVPGSTAPGVATSVPAGTPAGEIFSVD